MKFSYYTRLECSSTGEHYDLNKLQGFSSANKPLVAVYDLSAMNLRTAKLAERQWDMWRYHEVLPIRSPNNIVTLGEGGTPLLRLDRVGSNYDMDLWLKDEGQNPGNSFKSRGLSVAVSLAKEFGVKACVIPTAGNAGAAMSAYCARAGMQAHVFMPFDTPKMFKDECELHGAEVTQVNGSIADCGKRIRELGRSDWFDVSTFKEPGRLEGKKTMGYEIAEQMGWRMPDVIVYPTGGGTGLVGIWKAVQEMQKLGWLDDSKAPRMIAVQVEGCAPIVEAFNAGASSANPVADPPVTMANGLRVPGPFAHEMILKALQESAGTATTVSEAEMRNAVRELARQEGMLVSPEGAATLAALKKLPQGTIREGEQVLLLNTGGAYKYMENIV